MSRENREALFVRTMVGNGRRSVSKRVRESLGLALGDYRIYAGDQTSSDDELIEHLRSREGAGELAEMSAFHVETLHRLLAAYSDVLNASDEEIKAAVAKD